MLTSVNMPAKSLDTSSIDNAVHAFEWSPDGQNLYLAGRQHNKVHLLSAL